MAILVRLVTIDSDHISVSSSQLKQQESECKQFTNELIYRSGHLLILMNISKIFKKVF